MFWKTSQVSKIWVQDKIGKNILVCIVLVFAKKTEKKPVLGFDTALAPACPRTTFDGDSKSVVGLPVRHFRGEIRPKNS